MKEQHVNYIENGIISSIFEKILRHQRGCKKPKTKQANGLWGISIKTKERLNSGDGENLKFGVVVTLKEVNGINRMQEFIQQCLFRGWLVHKINVENRIDIYNTAEEELEFE